MINPVEVLETIEEQEIHQEWFFEPEEVEYLKELVRKDIVEIS